MRARLADTAFPALGDLTTREPADVSLALLDAWATVGDVLTFYNERFVNEFYLGTATERRSLVELGRLVGYEPRPGVAAGTHLAFTMDPDADAEIPAGTRVQNVPPQGSLPASFETSEPLRARASLNRLVPRQTRPQQITATKTTPPDAVWVRGAATGLTTDMGVLVETVVDAKGTTERHFFRIQGVDPDPDRDRTRVLLAPPPPAAAAPPAPVDLDDIVDRLGSAFVPVGGFQSPVGTRPDRDLRLAALAHPELGGQVYDAVASATATAAPATRIYALRTTARVFGFNVPKPFALDDGVPIPQVNLVDWTSSESTHELFLDRVHEDVTDGTFVVVERRDEDANTGAVEWVRNVVGGPGQTTVRTATRSAYGVSGPSTTIVFDEVPWDSDPTMDHVRSTVVHAGAELLELAEEPMDPVAEGIEGEWIELDGIVTGIGTGRLVAIEGERLIDGVPGIRHTEIARVAEVLHQPDATGADVAGDRNRSILVLDRPLRYRYKRDTVSVLANVVHATHGETRVETLGSGDASLSGQRFTLSSAPLTHVSAPTPSGVESTLELHVDDIRWPQRRTLVGLGPEDRGYVARTDHEARTTVVGGDGRWGRRFPNGVENVRARYRFGIGRPGNTDAGTITVLATRPLGVKEVANPVAATGGADPDADAQVRANIPLALRTLDRLVGPDDYADFARAFAGVGKATSGRLVVGGRGRIVVTIAGVDDIPIAEDGDLLRNLRAAMRTYGDPLVPFTVMVRERLVAGVALGIARDPDVEWVVVEARVRAALADAFGFVAQDIGEDLTSSAILAVVQGVAGVRSTTPPVLTGVEPGPPPRSITPPIVHPGPRLRVNAARVNPATGVLQPAQLAYVEATVPELVVLTEVRP
jgi:predicted phage baseplate assembly protein